MPRTPFTKLPEVPKVIRSVWMKSSSDPDVEYRVTVHCECPGFSYKGRCHHIIEVLKEGK